jgi:L-amino acid N-acyltransferase YncA
MLVTLTDGTEVRVRPIRPGDKRLLAAGLERLSEETIRRRFLVAKPSFSTTELRYLTEVDGHDHVALVAVLADDPERLIGVGRSVRLAARPDTAEMAIVVADAWQGHGLGSALAEALADTARANGIRRLAAVMLGENQAARRLVLRIGRRLGDDVHDGVRELTVDLAR